MRIIYNLGIGIYSFLIAIASLFSRKAKLWREGRKNIFDRISLMVQPDDRVIWFHCASLGEFEQGRPVMEAIRGQQPEYRILLTFFSPSGYEIRKDYSGADWVLYLPADTPENAEKFIRAIHPQKAVFVKYEFWYNYLRILHGEGIPTFLISANFRSDQVFFRWYGRFFREMLRKFTHLFVQNRQSADLLSSIRIGNISVAGDTRFDRVYALAQQERDLPIVNQFRQNDLVVVAGSTWKEDEALLIRYINEDRRKLKWIIAPHEVHEENIRRITAALKKPVVRFSEAEIKDPGEAEVLIIDNIGMLSSLYRYGHMAYIGGGFGKGIHNILEAATYGIPVIFGPRFRSFQEAVDLVDLEGAFPVKSYTEVKNRIDRLTSEPEYLENAGKIAKEFVKKRLGATRVIVEKLLVN